MDAFYDVFTVRDYGEIGCGQVVPFEPRSNLKEIVMPRNTPNTSSLCVLTACGNSLNGDRIQTGDLLILQTAFESRDIKENTICAVCVLSTGDLSAKRVSFNGNGTITLRASNGDFPDAIHEAEDIEIKGIVIGFQSMFLP